MVPSDAIHDLGDVVHFPVSVTQKEVRSQSCADVHSTIGEGSVALRSCAQIGVEFRIISHSGTIRCAMFR